MLKKLTVVMLLLTISLFSITVVSRWAGDPDNHEHSIEQIDDKIATAMKLTATATAVSAGISLLPDDTCTPIAGEIAELAKWFLAVLSALYLEKYMLTLTGLISFAVLIPLSCFFFGVGYLKEKQVFKNMAVKLCVFAIALFALVPSSVVLSDSIYSTYEKSIVNTINGATETTTILAEEANMSLLEKVKNVTSKAIDYVQEALANFVEAVAVMFVTTCVIPLLVVVIFLWLTKLLVNVNLSDISVRLANAGGPLAIEHK